MDRMITTFYFVRHGKSEAAVNGLVQGRGLNVPLTEDGHKQAQAVAEYLRDFSFDAIFASTASRAKETAAHIKEFHTATPYHEIFELNERGRGSLEGTSKEDFEKNYPDVLDAWKNEIDVRPGDGESFEDVHNRVMPIIEQHLEEYKGKTLLYVIHGNVIRVILGAMLHIPFGKQARIKQDYCAINVAIFDHQKNRWQVECINQTSYGNY